MLGKTYASSNSIRYGYRGHFKDKKKNLITQSRLTSHVVTAAPTSRAIRTLLRRQNHAMLGTTKYLQTSCFCN
jgi:hypothetical protein